MAVPAKQLDPTCGNLHSDNLACVLSRLHFAQNIPLRLTSGHAGRLFGAIPRAHEAHGLEIYISKSRSRAAPKLGFLVKRQSNLVRLFAGAFALQFDRMLFKFICRVDHLFRVAGQFGLTRVC